MKLIALNGRSSVKQLSCGSELIETRITTNRWKSKVMGQKIVSPQSQSFNCTSFVHESHSEMQRFWESSLTLTMPQKDWKTQGGTINCAVCVAYKYHAVIFLQTTVHYEALRYFHRVVTWTQKVIWSRLESPMVSIRFRLISECLKNRKIVDSNSESDTLHDQTWPM